MAKPRGAISRPSLTSGWAFCSVVFVCARLALSLVGVVDPGPQPPARLLQVYGPSVSAAQGSWSGAWTETFRWDAAYYVSIARVGYRPGDAQIFPGYPLAIRGIAALVGDEAVAALLVSNLCFLAALTVFFALTEQELGRPLAKTLVLVFVAFPTSFFFLAPYSESSFLLAALLAFWFGRRSRWGAAAVAGVACGLIRSTGLALMPALLWMAWHDHGRAYVTRSAAVLAPLIGVAAYFAYWYLRASDALLPFASQQRWHRSAALPPVSFLEGVTTFLRRLHDPIAPYLFIDVLAVALATTGVVLIWRRVDTAYVVYAIGALALPLSYPAAERPLVGMPRYSLVAFPAFWGLAILIQRRRLLIPWLVGSGLLWVALARAFGSLSPIF
jgi:hypothetical protein